MKKLQVLFLLSLLSFRIFADCYFNFDISFLDFNQTEDLKSFSGTVGMALPLYKEDDFNEIKSRYIYLFAESQFILRTGTDKADDFDKKDIFFSGGINLLEILQPKFSYSPLTKDFFISFFLAPPIPFSKKFTSNDSGNAGVQGRIGIEPMWNISDKNFMFNLRTSFSIYLDFSRKKRYEEKVVQPRREQYEKERRIQEEHRKAEEKIAKENGYSSPEAYHEALRKQRKEEEERKRKEEERKRQELIDSYKENYTLYGKYLFPKLLGKSADVIELHASDKNFVKNIPFGFRRDVYYHIDSTAGEIFQWIDRDTCLFRLEEKLETYNYYGSRDTSTTYTGLAYVHFDSSRTLYPFEQSGVLFLYTGVYQYSTAIGSMNTIPRFEAVFYEGIY